MQYCCILESVSLREKWYKDLNEFCDSDALAVSVSSDHTQDVAEQTFIMDENCPNRIAEAITYWALVPRPCVFDAFLCTALRTVICVLNIKGSCAVEPVSDVCFVNDSQYRIIRCHSKFVFLRQRCHLLDCCILCSAKVPVIVVPSLELCNFPVNSLANMACSFNNKNCCIVVFV